MAEHTVKVKTPALEVGKVDVVFTVRHDGQVHGRLKISRAEWNGCNVPIAKRHSTCRGTNSTGS
jgi:hypothetical protein